MRAPEDIFPLHPDERVLTQGAYRYRLNAKQTEVREPWVRYQLGDNTVTRTLRSDGHTFLLGVKAWGEAGVEFASFYWENPAGRYSANYAFQGNSVRWNLEGDRPQQKLFGQPTCFFPLMRVFSGETLLAIVENGGRSQVLVPSIKTPERRDSLFQPLLSVRTVSRLPDGAYDYRGGEYDDGARYELTESGLLGRYAWQQSEGELWEVELV